MTIINEKAYKILENSIVKNAVSHFYIFHGPKNVGKKNLPIFFLDYYYVMMKVILILHVIHVPVAKKLMNKSTSIFYM